MRRKSAILTLAAFIAMISLSAAAQSSTKKSAKSAPKKSAVPASTPATTEAAPAAPPAPAPVPDNAATLEAVLDQMDASAANFRSAEADFVWEQYQLVVNETDEQKGKVYFVRHEKDTHMAAEVVVPDKKFLVYTEGKVRFYQPRIDQVTEYDTANRKADVESFLVLGFGGRGHDLPKSYEVKLLGMETVEGVKAAKLELVPKSPKLKNTFSRIVLWVDTARDISVKQQFFEPAGDYRNAYYRNIKVNEKISDEVFKLKTTPKTKYVRPQ
ncbi:MAG: outer membrane lipoprotein carrier protein LolA [Acidobacteriales bacterium]|nr:outer membrane lipoprotein carrier protein LolA [Terriglobales bacterium]